MLSFLRAPTPPRRPTASQSTVHYEDNTSSQTFYSGSPTNKFFVRHHIPNNTSMFNPPPHIHFYQTETFLIESGQGIWSQPSAPASARETPRSSNQEIFLPAGTYHHFRNVSATEPLVVRFRIDPKMEGVREELFFRNFFGYLDDCRVAGTEPSAFQLQLFLLTVESGFAIPVPGPVVVKWWVSRLMMLFMGVVIGEWLLGYQRSYPEYYRGRDTE